MSDLDRGAHPNPAGSNTPETQEAVRASEERFRLLVERASDAIALVGPDGTIAYMGRQRHGLLGYTASEIVGQNGLSLIHPDERAAVASVLQELTAEPGGVRSAEVRMLHKDGGWRWIEATCTNLLDEPIVSSYVVNYRDITERRMRDAVTALGAEVGGVLVQNVPLSGMLTRCCQAFVQHLDAALVRVWTLTDTPGVLELRASAGLETHTSSPYSRLPLENFQIGCGAAGRRPHLSNDLPDDPSIEDGEWALREGLGTFARLPLIVEDRLVGVIVMFSRNPLREETLEEIAFVADEIALGIERKRVDEDLRRHQGQIEALNHQLRRAMKETHHRVRNNLQLIAALVDLQIMDGAATIPADEFRRIGRQVRALAAVHEILTNEAGVSGDAQSMSAREALLKLVTLFSEATPGRSIVAEVQEARMTARQGSSVAIIANELVTNAVKYSSGNIQVRFSVSDGTCMLEVLDEGDGYPPEAIGDGQTTGLSLMHHIAEWDLGGSLTVGLREGGSGARASLVVPLESDAIRA